MLFLLISPIMLIRSTKSKERVMEKQFVAFKAAQTYYCIDIMEVQEVIRETQITYMPNFPSFVEGVINLRGTITPILSIDKRLDFFSQQKVKQDQNHGVSDVSSLSLSAPIYNKQVGSNIKTEEAVPQKNQNLKLIIIKINKVTLGLLVDTLDKILTVDDSLIQNAQGLSKSDHHLMVAGLIHLNNDIYTVLNPKFVLDGEEEQKLTESLNRQ